MDWMSIRGEKDLMSEKEKWYTLTEASGVAGVPNKTLLNAIRNGTLVASQITGGSGRYGFHYTVSESALLEWVENRDTVKTMPTENTLDRVSEWITSEIQKAYEAGFRDGMRVAKEKMIDAAKELK